MLWQQEKTNTHHEAFLDKRLQPNFKGGVLPLFDEDIDEQGSGWRWKQIDTFSVFLSLHSDSIGIYWSLTVHPA